MANTLTTTTIFPQGDSSKASYRLVQKFTNICDGTTVENAVHKVVKANLKGINGSAPDRLIVERIEYDVKGMVVSVYFDRTSPIQIAVLSEMGYGQDYMKQGGLVDTGTGGTGDICVTTSSPSAGASYDITLFLRKSGG